MYKFEHIMTRNSTREMFKNVDALDWCSLLNETESAQRNLYDTSNQLHDALGSLDKWKQKCGKKVKCPVCDTTTRVESSIMRKKHFFCGSCGNKLVIRRLSYHNTLIAK